MNAGKDLFPSRSGWWLTRTVRQMRLIREVDPDIFCLNESTPLQQLLFFFMKGYRCMGWHTQNPVFFKKRMRCLECGVRKLSSGSKYRRTCTYVALEDGSRRFGVVCTHLDWPDGVTDIHDVQKSEVLDAARSTFPILYVCGDFNREHDTFCWLSPSCPDRPTYKSAVIDYIFSPSPAVSCRVLDGHDDLSDHMPLVCEFDNA